ncbi:aminotransferase [Nemania abortiva]|nr:aminotransferase [Nemania abortiva]
MTAQDIPKNDAASGHQPLDASKTRFTRSEILRPVPEPGSAELWAQNVCSDHMVTVRWTDTEGWEAPELKPFGDFTISPLASALHYATQCFEGMKVYRGHDGKLRLFRPLLNAQRLRMSAMRISLPDFDAAEMVKLIEKLMQVDGERWLPKDKPGNFLYLRPAMIGTGRQIGVQLPREAVMFIVAVAWPDFSCENPPGNPSPRKGLRLITSQEDSIRAWPGGFGYAKVGANYGPSFLFHGRAIKAGYDQILWLFGPNGQVTEAGASNFFAVMKDAATGQLELVTTPITDGIILDGVTRRSVLDLARSRLGDKLVVTEKAFNMSDLELAWEEGRLLEAFVSGTAFFITPVLAIQHKNRELDLSGNQDGLKLSFALQIKAWLRDITYGSDPHEWGFIIRESK